MVFSECKFLTEIPYISRIPNLEKLCVFKCKNLVKVHDSVGFLDKLRVLSFLGCFNLINFPRSLKFRSLIYLDLRYCPRLQNFPKIQCEMKYLHLLCLDYIAIKLYWDLWFMKTVRTYQNQISL
jgi:hypothetical protein